MVMKKVMSQVKICVKKKVNSVIYFILFLDEYLYSGSNISSKDGFVMILLFVLRHNLTYEAIADLLQLLRQILPFPNSVPTSIWKFKKNINIYRTSSPIYHYYCSNCYENLMSSSINCPVCTDTVSSPGYFITLPIKSQLKSLCTS